MARTSSPFNPYHLSHITTVDKAHAKKKTSSNGVTTFLCKIPPKKTSKSHLQSPGHPPSKTIDHKIIPNSFLKSFIHSTAVSTSSTQGSVCHPQPLLRLANHWWPPAHKTKQSLKRRDPQFTLYDVISNLLEWGTSYLQRRVAIARLSISS